MNLDVTLEIKMPQFGVQNMKYLYPHRVIEVFAEMQISTKDYQA